MLLLISSLGQEVYNTAGYQSEDKAYQVMNYDNNLPAFILTHR